MCCNLGDSYHLDFIAFIINLRTERFRDWHDETSRQCYSTKIVENVINSSILCACVKVQINTKANRWSDVNNASLKKGTPI